MRKFITTLFLTALSFAAFSQKNMLPGYIVLPSKDTVWGNIDYRNWEKNPAQIAFLQPGSTERSYTVNDIDAFGVTGRDYYRKATVSVDDNTVNAWEVSVYNKELIHEQTVFLRILNEGKELTLYEFVNFKPHYYIAKAGGQVEELIYKLSKTSELSSNVITYEDFKVQLKSLLSANGTLSYEQSLKIDKLNYKEKDLVKFASQVNGGTSSGKVNFANNKKIKPRLFAGGGVLLPNFGFNSADARLHSIKFKGKFSYIVTGGADFFAARNLQHLFLRLELSLSSLQTEGSGTSNDYATSTTMKNEFSLKQFNITPAVYVMDYFLRSQKVKVFGGIGVGYNFSSYPTHEFTSTNNQTGVVTKPDNYPGFEKGWLGLYGRLGATALSKVDFAVTARFSGSSVNRIYTKQKGVPFSFQVLYLFN
ncbi:MAG: hypothetical protein GXC78_12975 [Chitinophagaceae bacterium]|nr:hypothetical protein [Chitinophagaceae bacterium]